MNQRSAMTGTPWRATGFPLMRAMILLPLLVLAACGDKQGDQPGMATNIVDQATSDVREVPQGGNGIQTAEPAPDISPPSTPVGATIPASIQGRWTGLDESCADRATELELTITPTSLVFLESEGKATGVSHGPDGRIRIDAAFTGEGQSWNRRLELRPSAGGRELTMIDDGRAVTRKRCS
ncbi:hypothetical protein [Sphingobium chlorophenolicum]|uniref:Lipoprotein n=1 Tax=Sphingobium chlorophenolicum TaxID=46429 RepID=A0A081RCC1_SPHCR|nr:hypothetical protein [Sphingobium chlorophenolicum]KEQ52844.1 hypothetical protein BV95_02908 [Sphingobium chlorophenolicum]